MLACLPRVSQLVLGCGEVQGRQPESAPCSGAVFTMVTLRAFEIFELFHTGLNLCMSLFPTSIRFRKAALFFSIMQLEKSG